MRIIVGMSVGTVLGGLAGWVAGWLISPGSPLPLDDLDSVFSFFSQFIGLGAGSLLGFILGGAWAAGSRQER